METQSNQETKDKMEVVSPHISIINNHPKCKRTESTSGEAQSSGIDYKTRPNYMMPLGPHLTSKGKHRL